MYRNQQDVDIIVRWEMAGEWFIADYGQVHQPAPGAPIRDESTQVISITTQVHNEDLSFTVHVFKKGNVFVTYVPQLDVSSYGDTATAARRNIQNAVSLLLETSKERGTLTRLIGQDTDGPKSAGPASRGR